MTNLSPGATRVIFGSSVTHVTVAAPVETLLIAIALTRQATLKNPIRSKHD
jgi:hypothetical protein